MANWNAKWLLKCAWGEFTAAFLFVVITCGTAMNGDAVRASLAFGFTGFVLAYAMGHMNVCFNPAVTLGLMISKDLDIIQGAVHIFSGFSGGLCGGGFIAHFLLNGASEPAKAQQMTAISNRRLKYTIGNESFQFTKGACFTAEALLTGLLVWVVLNVVDKMRKNDTLAAFAVGSTIMIAHLVLITVTNCSINPMRSLATATYSRDLEMALQDYWIFLLAPTVGAVVAAVQYRFLFTIDHMTLEEKAEVAGQEMDAYDVANI